jgi:ligand-binding SRPBCC domain-containing protein
MFKTDGRSWLSRSPLLSFEIRSFDLLRISDFELKPLIAIPLTGNLVMQLNIGSDPSGNGFRLETMAEIAQPRERLFEFFSDAFQLEAITPHWVHFHVVTPAPIRIEAGTIIDYKLRIHGFPMRWQSKITTWEPPYRFVDEQIRGPYRRWHHEHVFEESTHGTLIRDIVHYSVPGGRLINRLFVQPDLRKIFAYRSSKLQGLFGQEDSLARK